MSASDTYRITQDPFDTPAGDDEPDLEDKAGMSFHGQDVIYIRPHMAERREKETLLHELMHVAFSRTGARHTLVDVAKGEEADPEELVIQVVSTGISEFLRDKRNRRLTEWLFSA